MSRSTKLLLFASTLAALGCATPPAARADDAQGEAGHRVRFAVDASREVANDWITARVSVTAEDAVAAAAAQTVNTTMAWALARVRGADGVESKSGGYYTHPVHEKGKLRRWRAGQDLILEGADVDAITALVGKLQAQLELRSFDFSVSHATRERVQEELVGEVLAAFLARATLVSKSLGAKAYAIDEVNLETGRTYEPRTMMRATAMGEGSMAPPAVEGGSSRVTVTARGSIVLE